MAVVPVVVPAGGRGPGGAPAVSPRRPAGEPTPSDLPEVKGGRRRRRQWAQSSRTVRHLNVWTVAKVSFIFYLLLFGAVVVASVMLWYVANAVGSIQSIEKSIRTLFDLKTFTFHPSEVAAYTSAGGGVLAILGTLGNVLAALMYNLISDLVGGIRFQVVDEVK
jgi:ABC-type multidrug transport system fused ATPase/permease subunit